MSFAHIYVIIYHFKTNRGLNIHKTSCGCQHGLTEEEYTIARINAVFGTTQHRWFRVEAQDTRVRTRGNLSDL